MSHYLLFIDDSGNREYDDNRKYDASGLGGKSLHFVYGAILIEQNAAAQLVPRLQELKRLTFGRHDVEVKSNWLRISQERKRRYLDPFGLALDQLKAFTDDYYRLLIQAPIQLIGAVVNKLHMQEDYAEPWYAPTVAYDVLLQRAVQAVPAGSTLAVTIDDISGKTPKNNQYKHLLAKHHADLRAHGSRLQRGISFECLDSRARFMLSQDSDMIQAADLISYCVHRQFRDHGEDWEKDPPDGGKLPIYHYFGVIARKFRSDGNGRIQGFGIVKFPLRRRVHWVIQKKG